MELLCLMYEYLPLRYYKFSLQNPVPWCILLHLLVMLSTSFPLLLAICVPFMNCLFIFFTCFIIISLFLFSHRQCYSLWMLMVYYICRYILNQFFIVFKMYLYLREVIYLYVTTYVTLFLLAFRFRVMTVRLFSNSGL